MSEPQVKTTLVNVTEKINQHYQTPCQFYFKHENEQPSGSFKLRGLGHLINHEIQKLKAEGQTKVHVFSSSGGNAGLAAAYASRYYQVPCSVILPQTAKPNVIEQLKEYGAEVIVQGKHFGEADAYMRSYAQQESEKVGVAPIIIHPFDHEITWEGHGDLIDELIEQLGDKVDKVKGIVCSIGGGGLYNGIIKGLERNAKVQESNIRVVGIESNAAPTFTEAIKQDKVVTLTQMNTIVSSLASPYIAQGALNSYRDSKFKTTVELINDSDAVKGTVDYYKIFGKAVEPACGATLVSALSHQQLLQSLGPLDKDDIVVFIVCGGTVYTEEDVKKLL